MDNTKKVETTDSNMYNCIYTATAESQGNIFIIFEYHYNVVFCDAFSSLTNSHFIDNLKKLYDIISTILID